MRPLLAGLALAAVLALTATQAFAGVATSRKVSAKLTGMRAQGGFAGIYLEDARSVTLLWTLSYSRLSGRVTAAEIRKGRVVVPLCGPCASGQAGSAVLSKSVLRALGSGDAYVTVHTAKNAAGEIGGEVTVSG
jgi:CHRD domain